MKNKYRGYDFGDYVEDSNGTIGVVVGTGDHQETLTVSFQDETVRSLTPEQLKPCRYSGQHILAMEFQAIRMYEVLVKIQKEQPNFNIRIWDEMLSAIQKVERKFPDAKQNRPNTN